METSFAVIVVVGLCLVALALHLKTDVEAMLKIPLFTLSLKAKNRRYRRK